jgi:hypothetical protein
MASDEWVRGRLIPAGLSIKIREYDIRNEMKKHFSGQLAEPLSTEKIVLFVKLYQAVAKDLDPDRIKICGHSYYANGIDNGPVDYGRLEIFAKQELLERCKGHFSAAEIEELSKFIESQRDGDGVIYDPSCQDSIHSRRVPGWVTWNTVSIANSTDLEWC